MYKQIIDIALVAVFGIAFLFQVIYYLSVYFKFTRYKKKKHAGKNVPVSVIISAKNEAENLRKNLPSILEQDYPDFEVIVVNDCSEDKTEEVLGEFLVKYKNLRTTNITADRKFTHGKKLALTVGIKAAKHEWLVFTDADCWAESKKWLRRLSDNFSGKQIVLGYGGYQKRKGLLNYYTRYDTMMIAAQYFAYAIKGNPYMGVGRNLAYRKSLFFEKKGFASHYGLASGDDDLFVNEAATKTNTAVEFRYESHTRTESKRKFREWRKQKMRHFSTANKYKSKHIRQLLQEPISRGYFYLSLILLLSFQIYWEYILIFVLIRLILFFIIVDKTGKRLNEKGMLFFALLFDLMSLFLNFIIYLSSRFSRKNLQWK